MACKPEMGMQMENGQQKTGSTIAARIAIFVAAVTFGGYLLNVLLGKAAIAYGWKIFYFDSIGEFLILLVASISFIAAALISEADWKSNLEADKN
jgi:hypothetical protein